MPENKSVQHLYALGYSAIKRLHHDGFNGFESWRLKPFESTESMQLGTAIELFMTNKNEFDNKFVISKVVGKSINKTDVVGRTILTVDKGRLIYDIVERVKNHKYCQQFFHKDFMYQYTEFHEIKGVLLKAATDFFNIETGVWGDFKSTRCANKEEFIGDFFKYGYDIQAALYFMVLFAKGLTMQFPYFVVYSTTSEWVEVFMPSAEVMATGIKKVLIALDNYRCGMGLELNPNHVDSVTINLPDSEMYRPKVVNSVTNDDKPLYTIGEGGRVVFN